MRLPALLALIVVLFLLAVCFLRVDEPKENMDAYCHMVYLNKQNPNDDIGWPDYLDVYDKVCDKDRWNGR